MLRGITILWLLKLSPNIFLADVRGWRSIESADVCVIEQHICSLCEALLLLGVWLLLLVPVLVLLLALLLSLLRSINIGLLRTLGHNGCYNCSAAQHDERCRATRSRPLQTTRQDSIDQ